MDNQQPGQVFTPQDNSQGSDNHSAPNQDRPQASNTPPSPAPTPEQPTPKTAEEIAAIDSAMETHQSSNQANQQPENQPETIQQSASTDQENSSNVAAEPQASPTTYSSEQYGGSYEGQGGDELVSWRASDSSDSSPNKQALLGLFVVGAIIVSTLIWLGGFDFGTISAIVVVVLAMVAMVVANRFHSDYLEEYSLDIEGVSIGEKFYPYSDLRAFSLIDEDGNATIELLPTKRFLPRLSMYLETDSADKVIETLAQYLPHEERQPDFVDKITRILKF